MSSKINRKVFSYNATALVPILFSSNISTLQASIKDNSLLIRLLHEWAFVGVFLLKVSFMNFDIIFSSSFQIASKQTIKNKRSFNIMVNL
jgi:hypothetical protein